MHQNTKPAVQRVLDQCVFVVYVHFYSKLKRRRLPTLTRAKNLTGCFSLRICIKQDTVPEQRDL